MNIPWSADLKRALAIQGRIFTRAAQFPGMRSYPYLEDTASDLRRTADWLIRKQCRDGTWLDPKKVFRFYADSYAVRALFGAAALLPSARALRAAFRWVDYQLDRQRRDGGFWVGYSFGDHDFDDPTADKTVAYVADAGEVTAALIKAYHVCRALPGTTARAERIRAALVRFRGFADAFRLRSGAMGLGYTERDLYRRPAGGAPAVRLPWAHAHHRPFPFATAVTGVHFYAGLFSITGDTEDWNRAMASLDWCLEHAAVEPGPDFVHAFSDRLDFRHLHRVLGPAFELAPCPKTRHRPAGMAAPRYADPLRQKLYANWIYCLNLLAAGQSDTGEWPCFGPDGRPLAAYHGALRHRLYFLYSLVAGVQRLGRRGPECRDPALAAARNLWLCADPFIRREHYGVCLERAPASVQMPTGLWGMILCELLQPGSTAVLSR